MRIEESGERENSSPPPMDSSIRIAQVPATPASGALIISVEI